ncbi:hypothetical protein LWS69_02335, partial [Bordetella hinzii]|nr:hypothetical protein [Bordetella hinzii]
MVLHGIYLYIKYLYIKINAGRANRKKEEAAQGGRITGFPVKLAFIAAGLRVLNRGAMADDRG